MEGNSPIGLDYDYLAQLYEELDDLMEDDNHPLSSSDPMLSSPAPSSFSSSSPSSFYSSDETLSPESIDLIV